MDYLEIVLNGYLVPNNWRHLKNYFTREFKKAEKKHYDVDAFFDGCLDIIGKFQHRLEKSINDRKHELYAILEYAKDCGDVELENQTREELSELKGIKDGHSIGRFYVQIAWITDNKIQGNIPDYKILLLKKRLMESYFENKKNTNGVITQDEENTSI